MLAFVYWWVFFKFMEFLAILKKISILYLMNLKFNSQTPDEVKSRSD